VGTLSLIGWFWFSGDTFKAAWNPQGLSIAQGMGSSISLTLWAFLGMESAAQNSSAVENPKRDVPLACLFGTLGAAIIYVLSTTVIQGIVPNAALADSTGPFGLAYEYMFNPTVGKIIMGLAVIACLGSLLGWQFTLAQTGKSAAEERMFPAFFSKVNKMGAPITGMIVLGVVQTLLALSTISPTLSEQFSALVNLAVVTNVIPYVVALSSLAIMMKRAKVPQGKYRFDIFIAVVAMGYSVFALYASGMEAVMGGVLVLSIATSSGALSRRASRLRRRVPPTDRERSDRGPRNKREENNHANLNESGLARPPAGLEAVQSRFSRLPVSRLPPCRRRRQPWTASGSPGSIKLGYLADARPFSFRNEAGAAEGYAVTLCQQVADQVKKGLALPSLSVEWVPVTPDNRLSDVQQGNVDLLCAPTSATLARRQDVSFSIPIFAGGNRAVLRADAPTALLEALGESKGPRAVWRGQPAAKVLKGTTFAVVAGTTSETWLKSRRAALQVDARIVPVVDYRSGLQQVRDGKADVFFGERSLVLGALSDKERGELVILDRLFTNEPAALALARGDEDFRLLVDRALSRFYASSAFGELYKRWYGSFNESTRTYFEWNTPGE
jgi:putrescine:ornithine antiporter